MLLPNHDLPKQKKIHRLTLENFHVATIKEVVGSGDVSSRYYLVTINGVIEVPANVLIDVKQQLTERGYNAELVEQALHELEFEVDCIDEGSALFGQWTSPLIPGARFGALQMLEDHSPIQWSDEVFPGNAAR